MDSSEWSYPVPVNLDADECGCLFLDPPWSSGDAVELCVQMTGLAPRIISGGISTARKTVVKPCLSAAETFVDAIHSGRLSPYLCISPYVYLCPHGIRCACIPLPLVSGGCRKCLLVKDCAESKKGGCLTTSEAGESKAWACPEAPAADDFELSVNMLLLMADHIRTVDSGHHLSAHGLSERQLLMVREVCLAIHEYGGVSPLRLHPIASRNMISVGYLCTLFSHVVGLPFRVYLQSWHLYRAKLLLAESNLSIREIALRSGYSDPNRMRLAFKAVTGLSPRAWREKFKG